MTSDKAILDNSHLQGWVLAEATCESCAFNTDCTPEIKTGQPIVRHDGVPIGYVVGDCFHKTVCGSRHMMRNPRGWAVDVSALDDAESLGAKLVQIQDRETEMMYRASIPRIRNLGIKRDYPGFGLQLLLPIKFWSVKHRWQLEVHFEGEEYANS